MGGGNRSDNSLPLYEAECMVFTPTQKLDTSYSTLDLTSPSQCRTLWHCLCSCRCECGQGRRWGCRHRQKGVAGVSKECRLASNIVAACLCCAAEGAVIADAPRVIHDAAAVAVLMKPRLLLVVPSSVLCLRSSASWLWVALVSKGNLQLMSLLLSCIELAKVVSGERKAGRRGNMLCWTWMRLWMGGNMTQTRMNETGGGSGDDERKDAAEYREDEGPRL